MGRSDTEEAALTQFGVLIPPGHAHRDEDLSQVGYSIAHSVDSEEERPFENEDDVFERCFPLGAPLAHGHDDHRRAEVRSNDAGVCGTEVAAAIGTGKI